MLIFQDKLIYRNMYHQTFLVLLFCFLPVEMQTHHRVQTIVIIVWELFVLLLSTSVEMILIVLLAEFV